MKGFLIFILSTLVGCSNAPEQSSSIKSETLSDSGFTNKAEAKNLTVNELKEGKWVEYYKFYPHSGLKVTTDTSAPIYYLTIYSSGKPFGLVRSFYKNGKMESTSFYSNGQSNGISKKFYENGTVAMETSTLNGKLNGTSRMYYKSGKIESESSYKDGQPNGMTKLYYENGKLKVETTSINGTVVTSKYYDSTGNEIK
jgi:antitoxin component YwqK of YwqJK toxin-antitoxin module